MQSVGRVTSALPFEAEWKPVIVDSRQSMKVFVTGATGFIGRALVLALRRRGHTVVGWVRCEKRARALLGDEVELLQITDRDSSLSEALSRCQGVVNLAGEPIFGKRWTRARRQSLLASRVSLTSRLATGIKNAGQAPRVFLSGSAVGFYGDRGNEELDESSGPGNGFLASLCQKWERAALEASSASTRVVCLRTGIVLGQGGGALDAMLRVFKVGFGGPLGNGRQFIPWIHLEDCVNLMISALENSAIEGPLNVVGPAPVSQRVLARALGQALRRPSLFPTPRIALKTVMGQAAEALLTGQKCYPRKATACGISFRHESIEGALKELLVPSGISIGTLGLSTPPPLDEPDYLGSRVPKYFLQTRVMVDAPLAEVFPFFSKPPNLALLTPPKIGFMIHRMEGPMGRGATIEYRLRVAGIKLGWRSRIERWEEGKVFVDSQERGPYYSWWHEHHFRAQGRYTIMEDRVYYAPPLGLLGRLAHRVFIAAQLREAFHYRGAAVGLRFGKLPIGEDDDERKA